MEVGGAAVSISRPTAQCEAAPTAATNHSAKSDCWPSGIYNRALRVTLVIVLSVVPVATPLKDIAVHVIQSPLIGKETVNWNSSAPLRLFLDDEVCLLNRYVFNSIGYWVLGIGYWVLGIGYWVLGTGYWVSGSGRHIHAQLLLVGGTVSRFLLRAIRCRLRRHARTPAQPDSSLYSEVALCPILYDVRFLGPMLSVQHW